MLDESLLNANKKITGWVTSAISIFGLMSERCGKIALSDFSTSLKRAGIRFLLNQLKCVFHPVLIRNNICVNKADP